MVFALCDCHSTASMIKPVKMIFDVRIQLITAAAVVAAAAAVAVAEAIIMSTACHTGGDAIQQV